MPIKIIDESEDVAPVNVLNPYFSYLVEHNLFLREKYYEWYHPQCDPNKLFDTLLTKYFYSEHSISDTVIQYAKMDLMNIKKLNAAMKSSRKFWFITLTSKEEWQEFESKQKIDKYRESHFRLYKYCWTEEHGTEGGKYHQHILVEGDRFHTGQNLKPTKYYDANINVKRVEGGTVHNIIKYMSKENPIQGNVEHFYTK